MEETINPRVRIILDTLTEDERGRFNRALKDLEGAPPSDWPKDKVTRIRSQKHLYLLRATPDLRVILRYEDGRIEVEDLVREATLRLFTERYSEAGAAP